MRDRDLVRRKSEGALERAKVFLWDRQGERMAGIYRQVLEKHGKSTDEIRIEIPDQLPEDSKEMVSLYAKS